MKFRTRLIRLERSARFDRGCPACRDRRSLYALVIREELADGSITAPVGRPAPCVQCGQIPEQILEIIEETVASPAAVGDDAEDLQVEQSSVAVIGGSSDIG